MRMRTRLPALPRSLLAGTAALMIGLFSGALLAQQATEDAPIDCSPEALDSYMGQMSVDYPLDFPAETDESIANLYRRGLFYQRVGLLCGYAPSDFEVQQSIDLTLSQTEPGALLEQVIAASSVGADPEAALAKIADLSGDPSRGQQLFNGLERALDGTNLTCAGCHNGQTAPAVEGTWTRIDEIHLQDPALAGYTVDLYLVESIVHPNAYIVPDYLPNLMPDYFGTRLDAQMLADLVAYLESQDQLIETP